MYKRQFIPILQINSIRWCARNIDLKESSHGTVGLALLGPNVSERLRSSREELPVSNDNFTSKIVLVLAHRNIGRVSRAIFFFLRSNELLTS